MDMIMNTPMYIYIYIYKYIYIHINEYIALCVSLNVFGCVCAVLVM